MAPSANDGGVEVAMMRPDNVHQITSRLFQDPSSHELPERYNWPDYERVDLWEPAEDGQETVPVIDLAGLGSGDAEAIERLTREVGQACEGWGFFQVVNHGVSDEVCAAMRSAGMSFLDKPVELKERATDPVGNYYGYGGRYERLKSRVPWMEFLAANHTPVCEADRIRLTIWPDGDPLGNAFSDAVKDYSCRLRGLYRCSKILQLLALEFGAACIITKTVGGLLQVLKGDTWRHSVNPTPVNPVPGMQLASLMFVVTPLDRLAWSNGRYESAIHQVLLTEKKKWRLSVIYALNPPSNILVSAPEELVDEDHPRKFRDFAWPHYIQNMRSNRHRIRDKVALDFITIGAKNKMEEEG
ncbi:hypothetical protein R1flu_005208 [Riccia fluitans]|uniref:Non-haem dioxygenase N-terminal domain-containing protein n=1 Tax=Riccia fluitans TaxID=41844 RepID=A0ABD1YVA9_9MARC